jgi:hypothetical protein
MALTLLDSPEKVAIVKNTIAFKVRTDNYITIAADRSHCTLIFNSLPTSGDTFTLEWDDNSVTFELSLVLPSDGTIINFPNTLDAVNFPQAIIAGLMKNYLVSRDFAPTYIGINPEVNINSRLPGAQYAIIATGLPSSITSSSNGGVDQQTNVNFKVVAQIWSYGTGILGVDRLIVELEQIPDINNDSIFEIESYLKPEVYYNPAAIGSNAEDTLCITPYFLQFVEFYGDIPAANGSVLKSDLFYALNAGVKKIDFPTFSFFNTWLPTYKKFLTWEPIEKIINKVQPEILYYFSNRASIVNLKAQIYYSDGTNQIVNVLDIGVLLYKNYSLAVDYNTISSLADPLKVILKYIIWLSIPVDISNPLAGEIIITEKRTYIIDTKRNFERYFLYGNSFGVFSCLRTYGAATISLNSEDVISENKLPYNYALPEAESKRSLVTSQDSIKVSTGYLPSFEWKKSLQDFLNSELIFEYKNGTYLPIIIITKTDSYNENDTLHSIIFEYRYGYTNNAFSNANNLI